MEYRLIDFDNQLYELSELYQKSWTTTYIGLLPHELLKSFTLEKSIQKWNEFIKEKDSFIYVAIDKSDSNNEILCGFAAGLPSDQLPNNGFLYSLHIKSEYRGKGIGKNLIMNCAKHFIKLGFNSLSLHVVVGNNNAFNIYIKLGAEILNYKTTIYQVGTKTDEVILIWKDLYKLLSLNNK